MVIGKQSPGTDIAIVVLVSVLAFLGEMAAADRLPWGEEARGVIAVLVGAAAAVALTLLRGGTLAELGFRRPRRWATVPLWAFAIFVGFVLAQNAAPLLVAAFVDLPQPDMSRYDYVRGNVGAAVSLAIVLPITAAIPEEILYRGFLIERLSRLLAGARGAPVFAVLIQALIFGSVHFQWGIGGVFATAIMGAVWGFAYLLCGRNLWIVIIAHSLAHVALVMQLYFMPPQ
ncbi:MAG: CPBP family intramembrane glutamic endopeptidase [Gammaproteobacteria bacterium]